MAKTGTKKYMDLYIKEKNENELIKKSFAQILEKYNYYND